MPFNAMLASLNRVLPKLPLAVGALLFCTVAVAHDGVAQGNGDIRVSVTRKGAVVRAQADFTVPVGAGRAFAVLTDYDRMRDFLPDVLESKIVERSPGKLVVSQTVRLKLGFMSIPLQSVRQVTIEPPQRLVSRALSGTVSNARVTTTLTEAQGKTLVSYDSEATLSPWLPASLGASLISGHIREQLSHMRAEMLRREISLSNSN